MSADDSDARVGVVILAAGSSSRLGRPKQLLPVGDGLTLLQHAARVALASACRPVIVVLGAHARELRAHLAATPLGGEAVHVAVNDAWAEGMGGSIRVGVETLCSVCPNARAVIIAPCDQPRLSAAVLDALVAAYDATGLPIAASEYSDALGTPALFACDLFPNLAALGGAEGARQIIARHDSAGHVARAPFPGGDADIDTPADYARFLKSSEAGPV